MEKEKQLLLLCRSLVELKLNWGDSGIWGNDDFDQLSEEIFQKTHIQLSVSTLKRIWGKVRYENFPTAGTLNALARFLEYDSWREFRQVNQDKEITAVQDEAQPEMPTIKVVAPEIPVKTKRTVKRTILTFIMTAAALVIVGIIYISSKSKTKPIDPSLVKFSAFKATDNLPNSVVFNYNASAFHSDSVYIQQSWDPRRRERVNSNGQQFTSIYYYPGYFLAKLVVDGEIEKAFPVFIKTKGWMGIIEKAPVPIYLSPNDIKGNGYMGVNSDLLRDKLGSPVFNNTWIDFANVKEYKGIDPSNFTFETTFRNSSAVEASVCRKASIVLLSTSAPLIINLADKGCISDINEYNGEVFISGRSHDLSAFGCDFTQFQNLQCRVEKHRFKIFLNGKIIMNTPQNHSIGKIVGIRFEMEGTAQIKNAKLSTPGGAVYDDDFAARH